MRRRGALTAIFCALAVSASAQPPAAGSDAPFLGGERSLAEIEEELTSQVPRRFRQVGTTSVALRIDFAGSTSAAFKPRTRTHPHGFQAEIAAYRVARLLGMDNVPPTVPRQLPRPLVEERFESDFPEDWEPVRREILWDTPGVARGAAIYWIPSMERTELATLAGLEAATPWLQVDGAIPEGSERTARDLSSMIAFDYLIGNWDRFSGGNVSTDTTGRLFVRDHNVAFQAPLTDGRYERIRGHLERTQRFSRSFVARVRALSQESLEEATVGFEGRASLLIPAQITGVLERKRALLSYVGGLAAVHGAERVLVWE